MKEWELGTLSVSPRLSYLGSSEGEGRVLSRLLAATFVTRVRRSNPVPASIFSIHTGFVCVAAFWPIAPVRL
jgi:hypothetical protein